MLKVAISLILLFLGTLNGQEVSFYLTLPDQSQLLQQQQPISFKTQDIQQCPADNRKCVSDTVYAIDINPQKTHQKIIGFGGGLPDSSAKIISQMSEDQQKQVLEDLFDVQKGIGLNFIRLPMGATGLTASGDYSYDDPKANETDPKLTKFSIKHDKDYIIPTLQKSFDINKNIKIYSVPFSPPGWMKKEDSGYYQNQTTGEIRRMDGGTIDEQYLESYAQYFVKFVQSYKKEGLPIYSIAPQNEPRVNQNGPDIYYPSNLMTPEQQGKFIGKYLGPALDKAGFSDIKIWGYENAWRDYQYPLKMLEITEARKYINGIAWHCYHGSPSRQIQIQKKYPETDVYMTECADTLKDKFENGIINIPINQMIQPLRYNASVITFVALTLDQDGGPRFDAHGYGNLRAVIQINSTDDYKVSKNVEYYFYGHVSKFVKEGAIRLDSNSPDGNEKGFHNVAFKNPDNTYVLFVHNTGKSTQFDAKFQNKTFTADLEYGSMATFIWK